MTADADEDLSHLLTPELIEAWRRRDHDQVNRLMHVKPWEPRVEDVTRPERPPWMRPTDIQYALWPKVWALRQALDRTSGRVFGQVVEGARERCDLRADL